MKIVRNAIFYLIILVSFFVILVSLLSLIYDLSYWYSKILDFPRLQYLVAALGCLLLFILLNKRWRYASFILCLGLLTAIFIHSKLIYPYLLGSKTVPDALKGTVSEDNTVGVVIANVLITNRQADAFLKILEQVDTDLILLMETDEWWINQLRTLKNKYPYVMEHPLDNAYGMALYSRLPLENRSILFLNQDDVPSFHAKVRLPSGNAFIFHGVHPVAPVPSKIYPDNEGEAEVALLKIGKMVAADSLPSLVAGDYNDVSWSRTARIFGNEGKLKNVRIGRGLFNTYDAKSLLFRWPLDHYFVTEEFALLELKRLPTFCSDHFPMFARLVLKKPEQ